MNTTIQQYFPGKTKGLIYACCNLTLLSGREDIGPKVILRCNSTLQCGELVRVLGAGLQIPSLALQKLMTHVKPAVYSTEDAKTQARASLPRFDSQLLHLGCSLLKTSVSVSLLF